MKNNVAELGKNTRFPVNRQDHTKKGPYLIPLLKKFLEKSIDYEDPETQKMIHGKVGDAVIWRLILNATQGENEAIKEILNRVDGKSADILIDQSSHLHITVVGQLHELAKKGLHAGLRPIHAGSSQPD